MEVYAQRLKRVHATNLKRSFKTAGNQNQKASLFKYSSVIKAFLAGLTCDVLRARIRQAADKKSLPLAQFLEVHRHHVTETLKSTGGPLYLVYPKPGMGLDLEQWNSRLLCTVLQASNSLDVRENDDVTYLCDLSKKIFHLRDNKDESRKQVLPHQRREWTKLFKIVQRLVENINDVNLIKQVRNFICKIEMEAGQFRTRQESQIRLETLISDMIADRVHPPRDKNRLTEEAVTAFRRQLTNISHVSSPKMLTKLVRPQSAGPRLISTKMHGLKQQTKIADTKNRPRSAIVRQNKTIDVKRTTTISKQRPSSAYAALQITTGKENKKPGTTSKTHLQSAHITHDKFPKAVRDTKAGHTEEKNRPTSAVVIRKVKSKNKSYSGKNVHRVTIVYKEKLKDEDAKPPITSPPLGNVDNVVTKDVENVKKLDTNSVEKSTAVKDSCGMKPMESEKNVENDNAKPGWKESMRNIVNEVLVHQKLQKAVANPLLNNKEFIDQFLDYLNKNEIVKQFLRIKSSDRKECFRTSYSDPVQLTFLLAFLSRHISPKNMDSAEYLVRKCLRHMTCKTDYRPITEKGHTTRKEYPFTENKPNTTIDISSKKTSSKITSSEIAMVDKTTTVHDSKDSHRSQTNAIKGSRSKRPQELTDTNHRRSLTRGKSNDSRRSRSRSTDKKPMVDQRREPVLDKKKSSTLRSNTEKRCWKCVQKEAAMVISINWGNKRICDILYDSGVPYSEQHLVAAVNAYDLETLTSIVKHLKQKRNWHPTCDDAELAMKLAVRYKMIKICKLLKEEGVTRKRYENDSSPVKHTKTCPSCFIT